MIKFILAVLLLVVLGLIGAYFDLDSKIDGLDSRVFWYREHGDRAYSSMIKMYDNRLKDLEERLEELER